jgi:hypothetical protein
MISPLIGRLSSRSDGDKSFRDLAYSDDGGGRKQREVRPASLKT